MASQQIVQFLTDVSPVAIPVITAIAGIVGTLATTRSRNKAREEQTKLKEEEANALRFTSIMDATNGIVDGLKEDVKTLKSEIENLKKKIDAKDQIINEMRDNIATLQRAIADRDIEISSLMSDKIILEIENKKLKDGTKKKASKDTVLLAPTDPKLTSTQ